MLPTRRRTRSLSAALLLGFAACTAPPDAPPAPADAARPAAEALAVRTDTLRVEVDSLRYTVAIGYPQLTGAAVSEAAMEQINATIRDSVAALAETFRPAEAVAPENRDSPQYVAEVEGSTGRVFLGSDVFSALVSVYAFTGGAHGNAYVKAFSFDLTTGAPVRLADLFRPEAPWADTLSAYADRALVRKMTGDGAVASVAEARQGLYSEGYAPPAIPDVTFTLGADSLALHFVPYEVAFYAFGGTDVPVAYSDLIPLMRRDGVAARFRTSR